MRNEARRGTAATNPVLRKLDASRNTCTFRISSTEKRLNCSRLEGLRCSNLDLNWGLDLDLNLDIVVKGCHNDASK